MTLRVVAMETGSQNGRGIRENREMLSNYLMSTGIKAMMSVML